MEMLISISMMLIVITASIQTFEYFSAQAQLARGREIVDNLLTTTNINSLTGKSIAADYYSINEESNGEKYRASRYFLYFQKNQDTPTKKAWEQTTDIVYGELQQGLPIMQYRTDINGSPLPFPARNIDGENEFLYHIVFTEKTEIPFPLFIQEILFTAKGDDIEHDLPSVPVDSVFVFFDAPFGKISFWTEDNINVKERTGSAQLSLYKKTNVLDLTLGDLSHELYLDFKNKKSVPGDIEIALQYKDRKDDDIDDGKGYWLREYIKYTSRNQLSHYWD